MSCLVLQSYTYDPEVTNADNPALHPYGLFDLNNPNNPFKDWSFVFIPYCTGDIHVGSNDSPYLHPYLSQTWTIRHRGHDNFLVVLKWITEHFAKPHEILVTGSSAGSYGAAHGFPWISEAYPLSKTSLLGDAGMGVSPEGISMLQAPGWNAQYPEWIFDGTSPTTTPDLWKGIAAYYPHSKIAEFTNAWDMTQIFFFDMVLQALGLPHPNSCSVWNALMLTGVDEKQSAPNYRSYVAAGTNHTLLGRPEFYTENSTGVSFLDWLNAMVGNQGGTKGHGAVPWENVMCFDCGAPAFCPF
jgi:hypothetical protein